MIYGWWLLGFFLAFGLVAFGLPLLLDTAARRQSDRVAKRWREEFDSGRAKPIHILGEMRVYELPTGARRFAPVLDEAVLLGPVSAWVAEGEARAVRDWEQKYPAPTPPPDKKWATLYHPDTGAYHKVPNDPNVLVYFQAAGWIRSTLDPSQVRHNAELMPRMEPPADISGFKMVEIR